MEDKLDRHLNKQWQLYGQLDEQLLWHLYDQLDRQLHRQLRGQLYRQLEDKYDEG